MKFMRQLALVLGLVVASGAASQADAAEIWTGWTKITYLYPAQDGMNFNTVYANTSLSSCDSGTRWFIATGTPNYQTLTAALIAAFMAGKEVNMVITVNPPQCAAVLNRFLVRE